MLVFFPRWFGDGDPFFLFSVFVCLSLCDGDFVFGLDCLASGPWDMGGDVFRRVVVHLVLLASTGRY